MFWKRTGLVEAGDASTTAPRLTIDRWSRVERSLRKNPPGHACRHGRCRRRAAALWGHRFRRAGPYPRGCGRQRIGEHDRGTEDGEVGQAHHRDLRQEDGAHEGEWHPQPHSAGVLRRAEGGCEGGDKETAQVLQDPTAAQDYDFTIPTRATYTTSTTDAPLGSIGILISDAVLFNPYEADGTTVAMSSNFFLTGPDSQKVWFVDSCSGHPGANGQYHYHALPACVTSQVDTGTHLSHISGLASDGFPIYGKRDLRGKVVSAGKLDKCNGITSATPEFPDGIYHYVLPGTTNRTSSIRCFHGTVDPDLIVRMPPMPGPPDTGPLGMGPPGMGPPPRAITGHANHR